MLLDFLAWPTLVKVLVCFVSVLVAGRLGLKLGLALGVAGPLLGLWVGMAPADLPRALGLAMVRPMTINLVLVVLLILVLSRLMQQSGRLTRIVESFTILAHSPRAVAAVMPALIGLLPMPGGALFSAPMVEAACPDWRDGEGQGSQLATVNYWFRHHGEYWWPLYPGVIFSVALLEVPMWEYVLMMAPLALAHMVAGWYFLLRPLKLPEPSEPIGKGALGLFLREVSPIITVVAALPLFWLADLVLAALGQRPPWPGGAPLMLGLVAAVVQVMVGAGMGLAELWAALKRMETLDMIILVLGVLIFQSFMTDSGAVAQVQRELLRYGIPTLAMVAVLPFISGLLTGIAFAFVAASFPLVAPLFADLHGVSYIACGGLAFFCGYVGMMLSPVHICFLMCRDYFECTLGLCYGKFIPALAAVIALAALWLGGLYLLA